MQDTTIPQHLRPELTNAGHPLSEKLEPKYFPIGSSSGFNDLASYLRLGAPVDDRIVYGMTALSPGGAALAQHLESEAKPQGFPDDRLYQ